MPAIKTLKVAIARGLAFAVVLVAAQVQAQSVTDDEGFREIRVAPGVAIADDMIDVVLPFLKGHPERDEGNGGMQLGIRKDDGGYAVNIVLTGYLDDSLYGEHYRGFVIPLQDDRWELLSMSVKPLCARGWNIDGYCQSPPPSERILAPEVESVAAAMCVKVAADDTLNLRAGPGTRHPVVGSLASDTCTVELFDICEGSWCQIRSGRISGWVNTRYLASAN